MYKIFLVEDDDAIAGAVVKHIGSWGWEARRAGDLTRVMEEFSARKILYMNAPPFIGMRGLKNFSSIIPLSRPDGKRIVGRGQL